MKVEFKRSFEKDLTKLRDRALLGKVKSVIEAIEVARRTSALSESYIVENFIATFPNIPSSL
jgi:mRNA-degrading endonuclease YafQ of YafQ-DinJ toxin-antitoxin module